MILVERMKLRKDVRTVRFSYSEPCLLWRVWNETQFYLQSYRSVS